jgi:hypothetical protein
MVRRWLSKLAISLPVLPETLSRNDSQPFLIAVCCCKPQGVRGAAGPAQHPRARAGCAPLRGLGLGLGLVWGVLGLGLGLGLVWGVLGLGLGLGLVWGVLGLG